MEYENEVKFYMGMQIYQLKEFKDKMILIDNYYKELDTLVKDYIKDYDNKNKSLLDSINDYINDNYDFIVWYCKQYNCFE